MHDNKMHTDKLKIREVGQAELEDFYLSDLGFDFVTGNPYDAKARVYERKRRGEQELEPLHEAAKRSHVEFAEYCDNKNFCEDLDVLYDEWMKSKTGNNPELLNK